VVIAVALTVEAGVQWPKASSGFGDDRTAQIGIFVEQSIQLRTSGSPTIRWRQLAADAQVDLVGRHVAANEGLFGNRDVAGRISCFCPLRRPDLDAFSSG